MNLVNPHNEAVRYAICKVHRANCFYTDQPLTKKTYTLDHIIPLTLKDKPEKLSKYLEEAGIIEPFEFDILENLVPADHYYNESIKKDGLLPEQSVYFYMEKARAKIPEVLKEIKNFKKNWKIGKSMLQLFSYVSEQENRELLAGQIYDQLMEEESHFSEENHIAQYGEDSHIYKKSLSNVHVYSFLPTFKNKLGSCLILFKSLKLRECMITLNQQQILDQLFKGLNTDFSEGMRGFIIGMQEDNVCIQLPNNRFFLSLEEAKQLSDMIDDYSIHYLNALRRIENVLCIEPFKRANYWNAGYRLLRINRRLWRELIRFTSEFDYKNGNSEWHIFYHNGSYIQVYAKDPFREKQIDFHVRLVPEQTENNHSFFQPEQEMWIVLDFSFFCGNPELVHRRGYWNAISTYDWLVKELIPHVIAHYDYKYVKRQKWYRQKPTLDEFKISLRKQYSELNSHLFNRPRLKDVSDYKELINVLREMQSYFARLGNYFLESKEIQELYRALEKCVQTIPLEEHHRSYIIGNLPWCSIGGENELLNFLNKMTETAEDQKLSYRAIQLLLSCMLEVLEQDKGNHLNMIDIQSVVEYMSPLWNKIEVSRIIDRWIE